LGSRFNEVKNGSRYPNPSKELDLGNYEPMPVRYQLRYSILEKIRKGEDPLPDIDGREKTKRDVTRAVLSCSHIYLVSREGTGKTRLAESLAELLPSIPKIKDCPYNDDPKWPKYWLCPRCREAENPAEEYGIEYIVGKERYSRIQGNEYTNEAKILGLKDIQAIAHGESPTDPKIFMGTGILRGNRGIVCIDELPAIPTKVQVLFHPILQENKIILEEYNWSQPIDVCFIATGNPSGFAHVNRIPEPLLDRLELIHMDMPEENIEKQIMFKEKFEVFHNYFNNSHYKTQSRSDTPKIHYEQLRRNIVVPWWIADVINKTARYTRKCPNVDKGTSIRGPIKAFDHTCSNVEIRKGYVAKLRDACYGLKLALRGRIKLRSDLIDFEGKPQEYFKKNDQIIEDIMWYAIKDSTNSMFKDLEYDVQTLNNELNLLILGDVTTLSDSLPHYPEIAKMVLKLRKITPNKACQYEATKAFTRNPYNHDKKIVEAHNLSALEMIVNFGIHQGTIKEALYIHRFFIPRRITK